MNHFDFGFLGFFDCVSRFICIGRFILPQDYLRFGLRRSLLRLRDLFRRGGPEGGNQILPMILFSLVFRQGFKNKAKMTYR